MEATDVIAIFDIGKTNKKLLLFDAHYRIVYENSACLDETVDEDGYPCENLQDLQTFISGSLQRILQNPAFSVKAVNFSAYGASFVHLGRDGQIVTPLYNYLKPYPKELLQQFYSCYGGEEAFSLTTASPILGHLNSGMQLYWLKYKKPQEFEKIRYSLHLPQYISYLLTGCTFSDLTSIGCHTNLWDFTRQGYHEWVFREGIAAKLAPIESATQTMPVLIQGRNCPVGIGLHDSSAALIPYLASGQEPFILISTGTWSITLNPFNTMPLTREELSQDCLCYLTYQGKAVKASRLFAGHEHDEAIRKLSMHFHKANDFYKTVLLNPDFLPENLSDGSNPTLPDNTAFAESYRIVHSSFEEAYHHFMKHLVAKQVRSTQLVIERTGVKKIFVDGGFSQNPIYMHLLAASFPETEVYSTSMAQASGLGAALAIHSAWNPSPFPASVLEKKRYGSREQATK
jgi:sugar (pentulose or hexulose) kinase